MTLRRPLHGVQEMLQTHDPSTSTTTATSHYQGNRNHNVNTGGMKTNAHMGDRKGPTSIPEGNRSSPPVAFVLSPPVSRPSSPTSNAGRVKFWLSKCSGDAVPPILHDPLPQDMLHMIQKDVPRVGWCPVNPEDDMFRLQALFELLRRISQRLEMYNQGLSFICAFALEAFDFQVEPAERVVLHLLFRHRFYLLLSPRTSFLQQYVDRFDYLFARVLPDLYAKFSMARFDTMFFAMDWFTTFFTNSLSRECCNLVWDVLIIDELEDGLFLCGLACLRALEQVFLVDFSSDDQFYLDFKRCIKDQLVLHDFRQALQSVVQVLIPSGLIPKKHSTIAMLESRVQDPNDVLVQIPFDATFLMRAVQCNDFRRVELEMTKYSFPMPLLEYALVRAVLLGHTLTVQVLLDKGKVSPSCPLITSQTTSVEPYEAQQPMLSPCLLAAHLGHGETLRCLLNAAFCSADLDPDAIQSTETSVLDVAKSLRAASGDEDTWFVVIAAVTGPSSKRLLCLHCGSMNHSSENCSGSLSFDSKGTTINYSMTSNTDRAWCTKCECALKRGSRKRRVFTCTRCQNIFCDRCADTFRTVNGKAMRACTTCHHFWGSCSCVSSGRTHACDHSSLDFVSASIGLDSPSSNTTSCSVCECDQCMQTFVRLNGKRLFQDQEFVRRIEGRCEETLSLVTMRMRQIGWSFQTPNLSATSSNFAGT